MKIILNLMSSLVFNAFPQQAHPLILTTYPNPRCLCWRSSFKSHMRPDKVVVDLVHGGDWRVIVNAGIKLSNYGGIKLSSST